jgi:hypothetical protein
MPRKGDSQQTTTALLAQKLDNLDAKVTEGFKTSHEKQDYTNGKVTLAGKDIIDLQKADAAIRAEFHYNRVIWYMLTVTVSVIIALASYILFGK